MTNEDFSHCTRNQSVWCVSSGLPGHDGSVSDVSSCGGVPHSRQPRGNVGEAPDGWWEKKHMPIHQEDTFFFQSVVVFDLIRCICQWQITHCLLPHTHTARHCLCTGQLHDLTSADASLADYFFHIAKLNQLLVLSQQLEEDMRHLGSHKYIAHQLSVIYVRRMNLFFCFSFTLCCHFTEKLLREFWIVSLSLSQQVISSFGGIQVFSEIKKDIEANFKQMKQSLASDEGSRHEPQLAAHYTNWWVIKEEQTFSWRRRFNAAVWFKPCTAFVVGY